MLLRENFFARDADQMWGSSQERVPSRPAGRQGSGHEGHRRVSNEQVTESWLLGLSQSCGGGGGGSSSSMLPRRTYRFTGKLYGGHANTNY